MSDINLQECSVDEVRGVSDKNGDLVGFIGADGKAKRFTPNLSKRTKLTKAIGGRYATVATGGVTRTDTYEFTLEAVPGTIEIGVLNNLGVGITGIKGTVQFLATSGALGDATKLAASNAASKLAMAWGGAATGTAVAGQTVHTIDNPNVTFCDALAPIPPARTDGGTLTVCRVTLEFPGTNANLPCYYFADNGELENDGSETVAPYGRFWRTRTQNVEGVTTAALFTSTVMNGAVVPIVIRYVPRKQVQGATVAIVSDSTDEETNDAATARRVGWWGRVQRNVSTPDRPMEICNLAIHGAAPSRFYDRVATLMPVLKPEILLLSIGTVNAATSAGDATQAASDINGCRGNVNLAKAALNDLGIFTILGTIRPFNYAARAAVEFDKLRIAYNAEAVAAPLSSRAAVIDWASVLSGPLDANGQTTIKAGLTVGGLHFNDAGAEVQASLATPLFRTLMTAA